MNRSADAPRSYLIVPCGSVADLTAAQRSGADALVLDLASSPSPEGAAGARSVVAAALDADRPVIVRIHAAGAPGFAEDLELCRHPGVAAVMLPRAEGIDAVCAVFERTLHDVLPVVETARGLEAARAVAQVPGVVRLVFDGAGLARDLGMADDAEALDAFRAQVVLAARLGGLAPPLDVAPVSLAASPAGGAAGAPNGGADRQALRAGTERARRFGFGARLCTHAWQAVVINESLAPRRGEAA